MVLYTGKCQKYFVYICTLQLTLQSLLLTDIEDYDQIVKKLCLKSRIINFFHWKIFILALTSYRGGETANQAFCWLSRVELDRKMYMAFF